MSKMPKILILLLAVYVCLSEAGSFKRVKSLNDRRAHRPKARARYPDSRNERSRDRHGSFSNRGRGRDDNEDYSPHVEAAFKRKKSLGTRKSDRTRTQPRYPDSRTGRFRDRSEGDRSRRRGQNSRPSESYESESANSAARTIDSSDAVKSSEKSNVNETERDITFEDFSVQNEDVRNYVNNLRARITRLEKIRAKFADVQSNHVLRYRMDAIETKYLTNIKFIEENQDYNKTILKLKSTFNDKRKADGWTQMVNVTKITVREASVPDKAIRNETKLAFAELPKTFLTRYEKWYAVAVWLQGLSSSRRKELEKSYPIMSLLRSGIMKQFPEGPISTPEIATGMDNLYGIISSNVKTCLAIPNLEACKIPRKPLISYKRNEAVLKCANVLIPLKEI